MYQSIIVHTFDDAMSETDLCVWMVSNWSKHQSSSSIVSIDILRYASSEKTNKDDVVSKSSNNCSCNKLFLNLYFIIYYITKKINIQPLYYNIFLLKYVVQVLLKKKILKTLKMISSIVYIRKQLQITW